MKRYNGGGFSGRRCTVATPPITYASVPLPALVRLRSLSSHSIARIYTPKQVWWLVG
ncbi:hypothetical protein QUB56_29075 [Microcoleus sp. AR_TQ3_B6]|uniref:hypothetical protein n=1 Tax=Microcoleus sp. AR_TQ3_B6 TaxID=3055284 RepID=UPI002FD1C4FC